MEVFARSIAAESTSSRPLARVAEMVQAQMEEVENGIAAQATAFDPAMEGYVSYAIGGRGKRLRPLVALLSGGATGAITSAHIDLAVIIELIHIATLVHDDIMDDAERRRGQPTVNARWGNSLSVLLGDCLFAQALKLSTNFEKAEVSRAIAQAARGRLFGRNHPNAAAFRSASRDRRLPAHRGDENRLAFFRGGATRRRPQRGRRGNRARPAKFRNENRRGLPDLRRLSRSRRQRIRHWQNARDGFAQRKIDAADSGLVPQRARRSSANNIRR